MSVANILKTPTLAPSITSAYADGSGGGSGLFLPLLGGAMDALPAGVIKAHTITDILRLEGASGLGELLITTNSGGDDISIDATPSSGLIYMDAVDVLIRTQNSVDILGSVIVQPPVGYVFPSITSAVDIKNWVTDTDTTLSGLNISNIESTGSSGSASGIDVAQIKATDLAYGMLMNTIQSVSGSASGISMNNTTAKGDAYGLKCEIIESLVTNAYGSYISDITAKNAVTGYSVRILNSVNGDAKGIDVDDVESANANAFGLFITAVKAPNGRAYGIWQDGASNGNVLKDILRVGENVVPESINASLRVFGTSHTSIQSTGTFPLYTIGQNAGNTVVSTNAINTDISMPVGFGAQYHGVVYLIIKKHTGNINILGGGLQINGVLTPFIFSGPTYSSMTCVWDGTEWLANIN